MPLSQEAMSRLFGAGWYTERNVDVDEIVHGLKKLGFEVHSVVKTFLSEFYQIRVPKSDNPSKCVFDMDPLPYATYYQEFPKYRQQKYYEAKVSGPLCIVGISEISDFYVLSMDQKGRFYITDEIAFYFSLVGETSLDAIEKLLYRDNPAMKDKYSSKLLAPYNENQIAHILTSNPVIACMGHKTLGPTMGASDYSIDHWLRSEGYRVYTVNPFPEKTNDVSNTPVYTTLAGIPEPIDMIVYHDRKATPGIIEEAISNGVKIIFPSFTALLQAEELITRVENAQIEYIDGIDVVKACKRVLRKLS